MLKTFRNKNVTKIVLWGILILILPAFVMWGSGSIGSKEKRPESVGLIFGKKVTFDEFSSAIRAMRCQIIMNYFNQEKLVDTLFKDNALMAKMAWDRVIMLREARMRKVKVSDRDVVQFIKTHPLFVRNGKFDDRIYGYVLKNNFGMDPRTFEEITRENLEIRKSNDEITKDVKITDEELLQNYKFDNEKYKISYVLIPASDFTASVNVDDAEAADYYEKHKVEFLLPSKEGASKEDMRLASLEDVKSIIVNLLSEAKARPLSIKDAEGKLASLKALIDAEKMTFEAACEKLGLKTAETSMFSKSDYIDGVGESMPLVNACVKLNKDDLSGVIETRKGAMIFKLVDAEKFDDEKFKKDKDEYSKTLLDKKKNSVLEDWLRRAELATTLNINFEDYEKYYK